MAKGEIRRSGGNGRRSTCVAHDGLVYLSGITTVDIEADITAQAKDVMGQIDRLLAHNNSNKQRVLSASVVLQYHEDYGAFNQAWDEWVDDDFEPAQNLLFAELPLKEYRVMISLVAAEA